ncbi:PH domain-containing protein [Streptomyces acidiscabies]|uniref:PH domain-containing protein n=1 Tax=Streptomyces acidiscabies TaxID=42234 RepID=UPI0038F719E5
MTLLSVTTAYGALAFSARDLLILALGPTAAVLLVPFFNDDRVRLTEFDVRFRGGFRSHKVRWSDIARLEVRSLFGVRQLVLHTTSGKRRTLPAPHSFADPGFDDKAREITDRWLRHRA